MGQIMLILMEQGTFCWKIEYSFNSKEMVVKNYLSTEITTK